MKSLYLVSLLFSLLVSSAANSQSSETENLLTGTWSGSYTACTPGVDCWAGTSGGSVPNYGGGTFYWGWGGGVVRQTIAINQALQEAGIQVNGYRYSWTIKNGNANLFGDQPGTDPFYITVSIYKADSSLYKQYTYNYSGSYDWTTFSGSTYFGDPFLEPAFFGNLVVSAFGDDTGNWAGYYGPEFATGASSLNLIYSANLCYTDPLADPSCPGYAEAFAEQLFTTQCTANPLYDMSCPGYQDAYFNSMCNADPQYSPLCPNYTPQQESSTTVVVAALPVQNTIPDPIVIIEATVEESTDNESEMTEELDEEEGSDSKREKVKELVKDKLKSLAEDLAAAADVEAQMALQAQILALMSYVPGFSAYNAIVPDGLLYVSENPYEDLYVPDSRQGLRNGLAQELKHREMVQSQYN